MHDCDHRKNIDSFTRYTHMNYITLNSQIRDINYKYLTISHSEFA